MKIKKNDIVKIISGSHKNKGVVGRVLAVFPKTNRLQIEGAAKIKRHIKPQRDPKNPEGGIIEKIGTIHVSNAMLMSQSQNRPVRVGYVFDSDRKKTRITKGRTVKQEII